MTENELRQKVVSTAKKYLGCNENDGSHKKIIDIYNSHKPLARGYQMPYTVPWCATFVSAIAVELALTDIMPTECGCPQMMELYKKLGRWQENDAFIPEAGDIIFYDWDDGRNFATTDATGRPEHVGIVTGVSGGMIAVVEGNKNDAVQTRNITVNGRYIRGFGLPDYAGKATSPAPKPKPTAKCPYAEPKKNILYGAKGNHVKWLQWHLNQLGEKLKIDGVFGKLTKAAVLKFQRTNKLTQDGIVGPITRGALKNALKNKNY
jgi:hypothetical protein